MLFGMTFSPNHDNTQHYQMLIKTVGFIGSSNVSGHHPKVPCCSSHCRGEESLLSALFLPFFCKTPDREEVFGRGRDEEHIVEFFVQSIYCNLESSAVIEGLILQ